MKFPNHWQKTICPSPLGDMLLAASPQGLAGAWFVHLQKHMPQARVMQAWPIAQAGSAAHDILQAACTQLSHYFSGAHTRARQAFDLPLDVTVGTDFQQAVWQHISRIGISQTNTYGAIAQALGKPQASRAVGAAVGRNPISIIIPCHRVMGGSGALTGYAGGMDRKTALLQLEGVLL